jgi:hypothetical protein
MVLPGLVSVPGLASVARDAKESIEVDAGKSFELGDSSPWRSINLGNGVCISKLESVASLSTASLSSSSSLL